ncbi:Protein PHYTOCHROME KINASE SUBSTRATE 4 [Raphanus sativus]|nr:Protein PHYTOCHROME KINASE SUBSTRATE 4 [Raphanus sativus]
MAETTLTVVATKRDALDPYIKIIQSRSLDIDVSFSSYLKPDNNEQKEQEDTEISIFEARGYFNESGSNDRSSKTTNLSGPRFSSASSAKVSSFTVGHTASSEASWNSQTGLLRDNNRQKSDHDGRGSGKKGPRWFFRRRTCPCSSSKSVQVQETKPRIAEFKTGSDRTITNRIVHHNHQTISSSDPVILNIPSNTVTRSIDYAANREPRAHINEEAASDASSDLFEIESFSTQHVARPWALPAADSVRSSIDETATEYGYEPSEASVTWSVTTAEPVSRVACNFSRINLSQPQLAFGGCDKEKAVMVSVGQRFVQPLKSVGVQDDVMQKVLCNNGSSKLSVTRLKMLDNKSSFLV